MEINLEAVYEAVLDELERNGPRRGLWALSFAKSKGDENVAKAYYLEVRAQELLRELHETGDLLRVAKEQEHARNEAQQRKLEIISLVERISGDPSGTCIDDCMALLDLCGWQVTRTIDFRSGLSFIVS